MSESSRRRGRSSALFVGLLILIALLVVRFLIVPEGEGNEAADDGLAYEERVTPVLHAGLALCARIETNAPVESIWADTKSLAPRWAEVRTAPGYDRARHDDFIIKFGRVIVALQSGEIVWNAVQRMADDAADVPEADRTSVLFAVQGIHGAETAAQLQDRRSLTLEALLSRTNLMVEVTNSLRVASEAAQQARTAHAVLVATAAASDP